MTRNTVHAFTKNNELGIVDRFKVALCEKHDTSDSIVAIIDNAERQTGILFVGHVDERFTERACAFCSEAG